MSLCSHSTVYVRQRNDSITVQVRVPTAEATQSRLRTILYNFFFNAKLYYYIFMALSRNL